MTVSASLPVMASPSRWTYRDLGIVPDQAPHAVETFGNIQQVEDKVVQPQIKFDLSKQWIQIRPSNCWWARSAKIQIVIWPVQEGPDGEEDNAPVRARSGYLHSQGSSNTDWIRVYRGRIETDPGTGTIRPRQGPFSEAEKNVELEKERVVVDTDRQFQSTWPMATASPRRSTPKPTGWRPVSKGKPPNSRPRRLHCSAKPKTRGSN